MALFTAAALALMASGPAQAAPQTAQAQSAEFDVGYDALADGRDLAAIETIGRSDAPANDPARLINMGIALARTGEFTRARSMFEAAIASDTRYDLETADGDWVDSRRLARRALALLEGGEFQRYFALSMR